MNKTNNDGRIFFKTKLGEIEFELTTPHSDPQQEPFNPLPGLIDFDRILNDFMNAHKHEENDKETRSDKILSPKYQHIPPMRSIDAMYKLKADITLQEQYDKYIQHVNERVHELYDKLESKKNDDPPFKVTIASADDTTCSLGTGLAKNQWIEEGYTYEHYRQFMDHLHQSLKGLKTKYSDQVVYGEVSGTLAGPENYHVWGANTTHMKLKTGDKINGAGQAEAMETMGDGVFGIVTTPLAGPPELKHSHNKDEIDILIDELKNLAKGKNPSAESVNSQSQPIEKISVGDQQTVIAPSAKRTPQKGTERISVMNQVETPETTQPQTKSKSSINWRIPEVMVPSNSTPNPLAQPPK